MTNDEIMREALLDEFIDELKSNRLNESAGFSSVDLRIMEAYDFTPFDVIESDNLAKRYPDDLAPIHEGLGSFIGGLLMKPAVAGAGLNVALATIIAVAEKFLPGGDGVLGKIGDFLRGHSASRGLVSFGATTIPGILAAAYKVSVDPDYKQAKVRHNKAVCKRMMKKAILAAGVTGIIANVMASYLISPKASAQLAQTGSQAETAIEQAGKEPTVDAVAKEVAVENKLDATETKEVAAIAATNGATTDAICKDTQDKQIAFDTANKSYTDALNAYNKAANDGLRGQGLGTYQKALKTAEFNLNNAEKALITAQNKEQKFQDLRWEVNDNVGAAFDAYKDRVELAGDINNNQSYLTQLGVGSTTDAANLAHANNVAAKNGIDSPFGPITPTNQPDAHETYNQKAALAASANTEQPKPVTVTPPVTPTVPNRKAVNSVANLLNQPASAETVNSQGA